MTKKNGFWGILAVALIFGTLLGAKGCGTTPDEAPEEVIMTEGYGTPPDTDAAIPEITSSAAEITQDDFLEYLKAREAARAAAEKPDLLKDMPEELQKLAEKIDIKRYFNAILITTDDDITFQEVVNILKTKTPMNLPVGMWLDFKGATLRSKGEFKWECSPAEAVSYREVLKPYKGMIYIYDGYWKAVEYNARALFPNPETHKEEKVSTTEYWYANATVYKLNDLSYHYFRSRFDKTPYTGTGTGKGFVGDGSTSGTIITEFDK